MNIAVSFACSLGLDFKFARTTQGEVNQVVLGHNHADHEHHDHSHVQVPDHHSSNQTREKDKDDCCNDEVLKFQNIDKNLNQNTRSAISSLSWAVNRLSYLSPYVLDTYVTPQLQIINYLFPPGPDILIAFQRFQI